MHSGLFFQLCTSISQGWFLFKTIHTFLFEGHITVLRTFFPAFHISFCLFVCFTNFKMPLICRFYGFILILNLDLLDQIIYNLTKRGKLIFENLSDFTQIMTVLQSFTPIFCPNNVFVCLLQSSWKSFTCDQGKYDLCTEYLIVHYF